FPQEFVPMSIIGWELLLRHVFTCATRLGKNLLSGFLREGESEVRIFLQKISNILPHRANLGFLGTVAKFMVWIRKLHGITVFPICRVSIFLEEKQTLRWIFTEPIFKTK